MSQDQSKSCAHEDASIFCGESTYDFIDDQNFTATDDESLDGMTGSTISSRQNEPLSSVVEGHEQLSSLAEPTKMGDDPDCDKPDSQVTQPPPTNVVDDFDDFDVPAEREPIIYDETGLAEKGPLGLLKVSCPLDGRPSSGDAFSKSIPTELSVQQVIGDRYLSPIHRPYKVLYLGDRSSKDAILHKIAAALTATPSNHGSKRSESHGSKYNIVPISNIGGNEDSEVVLIDSTGLEIEVEECSSARSGSMLDGKKFIGLTFAHGPTVTSYGGGSSFILSGTWKPPDLAVISTSSRFCETTSLLAWEFLKRQCIPTLVIGSGQQTSKGSLFEPINHILPHLCLEENVDSSKKPVSLARLPIDLAILLRLDAAQLNRTLACVNQTRSSKTELDAPVENGKETNAKKPAAGHLPDNHPPKVVSDVASTQRIQLFQAIAIVLILFVSSMTLFRWWAPLAATSIASPNISETLTMDGNVTNQAHRNNAHALASSSRVIAHPKKIEYSQPGGAISSQNLSFRTDLASFIHNRSIHQREQSETFKVHVLGDSYIVFMPPHWLAKSTKALELSFSLTRKGKELPFDLVRMFDNIYALHIPLEEAYGNLQAKVWSSTLPTVNQSLEIDLGSSWLKIAVWRELFSASVRTTKHELGSRYRHFQNHAGSHVSGVISSVRKYLVNVDETFRIRPTTPAEINQSMRQIRSEGIRMIYQMNQGTRKVIETAKTVRDEGLLQMQGMKSQCAHSWQQQAAALWQIWHAGESPRWLRYAFVQQTHDETLRLFHNAQKKSLKVWWKLCQSAELQNRGSHAS